MSQTRRDIRSLRSLQRVKEEATGRVLEKPAPPPMRTGVRGAWIYRDDPPAKLRDKAVRKDER